MSEKKFGDGEAFKGLDEAMEALRDRTVYPIPLAEVERQMVLLALAELSLARPGWLQCLEAIAFKMDNVDSDGRAAMFERFRRNHSNAVAEKLAT